MDLSRPWVLRGLVIALAIAVGALVYIATSGGDDDESEPAPRPEAAEARILSAQELADVAGDSQTPIYWAGEIDDTQIELTEEGPAALIRYLQEDEEPGAQVQRVTVGTYALPDPRKALNTFAKTPGATVTNVEGLGKVVIDPQARKNVYFVDPDDEVQVEVYAPSAKRAIGLVRSGQVQPVG